MSIQSILQAHPHWGPVFRVLETLTGAGFKTYLAGGCVRDALLERTPNDLDVATAATPDQVIGLFEKSIEVGKVFGVVRVIVDGIEVEVATFRKDGPIGDGRRPQSIEFSNEREDANRRDFTVNALFWDHEKDLVIDYVEGLKDLKLELLSTVGEASHRFLEDRLRILRAIRFAVQLEFKIEERTWREVCEAAKDVRVVSQERIRDELIKIFKWGRGRQSISLLVESGLWRVLFPEFEITNQQEFVIARMSHAFADPVDLFSSLFAAWAHDSALDSVIGRLRLGRSEAKALKTRLGLLREGRDFWKRSQGQQVMQYHSVEIRKGFDLLESIQGKIKERERLELLWRSLLMDGKLPNPFLTGSDVSSQVAGSKRGEVLALAYEKQLEGDITSRGAALNWFSDWLESQKRKTK